jgi:hypothetical protein
VTQQTVSFGERVTLMSTRDPWKFSGIVLAAILKTRGSPTHGHTSGIFKESHKANKNCRRVTRLSSLSFISPRWCRGKSSASHRISPGSKRHRSDGVSD